MKHLVNMKIRLLILFISSFVLLATTPQRKTKEPLKFYQLSLKECWENNMSDYLEVVKIVPLETTKKSLLGRIYQVHVNNEEILVWDRSINKLLLFDTEGNFKTQIGSEGRGPKEYISISDISVKNTHDTIGIYDSKGHKILLFNNKNEFYGDFKVNSYFQSFDIWKDKQIVLYNRIVTRFPKDSKISNFCVYSFDGKLLHDDIFYTHEEMTQTLFLRKNNLHQLEDGSLTLQRYLNDTVFKYNGKYLEPRLFFDFSDLSLTYSTKQSLLQNSNQNLSLLSNLLRSTKYFYNTGSVWFENERHFFTTRERGKPAVYFILADIITDEAVMFDFARQDMIWRFLQIPVGLSHGSKESYLIFTISPGSLIKLNEKYSEDLEKFKSEHPKQAAIIEAAIAKINIADNPLLVYAKIK